VEFGEVHRHVVADRAWHVGVRANQAGHDDLSLQIQGFSGGKLSGQLLLRTDACDPSVPDRDRSSLDDAVLLVDGEDGAASEQQVGFFCLHSHRYVAY
jgi:hypothetical protein